MEPPTALFVGHSFAKRYGRWIGSPSDGAPNSKHEVCDRLAQFNILGTSGLQTDELLAGEYLFHGSKHDIVLLDCSSNDLANENDVNKVCNNLLLFARHSLLEGAAIVVIMSALPRARRMQGTAENFKDCVTQFNDRLKELCVPEKRITFHRITGFTTDAQGKELSIDNWSDDGIHPSPRRRHRQEKSGMEKYHQAVKTALHRGVQRLKHLTKGFQPFIQLILQNFSFWPFSPGDLLWLNKFGQAPPAVF